MTKTLMSDKASISIELESETWEMEGIWRGGEQLLFIFNLGCRLGSTSKVRIIANYILALTWLSIDPHIPVNG